MVSVQANQPKNWAATVGTPLESDTAFETSLNWPTGSYQFISTSEMMTSRKPVATPAAPLRFRYGASNGQNVIAKNSATPMSRNTTMRGEKTACLKAMPKSVWVPSWSPIISASTKPPPRQAASRFQVSFVLASLMPSVPTARRGCRSVARRVRGPARRS